MWSIDFNANAVVFASATAQRHGTYYLTGLNYKAMGCITQTLASKNVKTPFSSGLTEENKGFRRRTVKGLGCLVLLELF